MTLCSKDICLLSGCSVGSIDYDPLNNTSIDEALGNIFLLPDDVSCNGTLISWDGCGVFNPKLKFLTMFAGIYRPTGATYEAIHYSTITIQQPSTGYNYICFRHTIPDGIQVRTGDRLFGATMKECSNNFCPLNPAIWNALSSEIMFISINRNCTVQQSSFKITTTNAAINLRAHINPTGLIHTFCVTNVYITLSYNILEVENLGGRPPPTF